MRPLDPTPKLNMVYASISAPPILDVETDNIVLSSPVNNSIPNQLGMTMRKNYHVKIYGKSKKSLFLYPIG